MDPTTGSWEKGLGLWHLKYLGIIQWDLHLVRYGSCGRSLDDHFFCMCSFTMLLLRYGFMPRLGWSFLYKSGIGMLSPFFPSFCFKYITLHYEIDMSFSYGWKVLVFLLTSLPCGPSPAMFFHIKYKRGCCSFYWLVLSVTKCSTLDQWCDTNSALSFCNSLITGSEDAILLLRSKNIHDSFFSFGVHFLVFFTHHFGPKTWSLFFWHLCTCG